MLRRGRVIIQLFSNFPGRKYQTAECAARAKTTPDFRHTLTLGGGRGVLLRAEALRAVEAHDLAVDVTVGQQEHRGVGELRGAAEPLRERHVRGELGERLL